MVGLRQYGNNETCPCGSGRKYKKCCLVTPPLSPKEQMLKHNEKIRHHAENFGQVRRMVTFQHNGMQHVAVGSKVLIGKWKTFTDFLAYFIKTIFTPEWGKAEIEKPEASRHPLIVLYQRMCYFQKTLPKNDDGLYHGIPNGAMRAYLLVAYDLYLLDHHMHLSDGFVQRLKNRENFQGARHELFAAATCLRAGFKLQFENEKDGTKRHTEFIAIHVKTGQQINVEAKSRHRAGVLAMPGSQKPEDELRVRIVPLLNDAIDKPFEHPYVIFVDLNLPPEFPFTLTNEWFYKVANPIIKSREKEGNTDPWNMLVLSNYPDHYQNSDDPAPFGYSTCVLGKEPPKILKHPEVLEEIFDASQQFGNMPQFFDTRF